MAIIKQQILAIFWDQVVYLIQMDQYKEGDGAQLESQKVVKLNMDTAILIVQIITLLWISIVLIFRSLIGAYAMVFY